MAHKHNIGILLVEELQVAHIKIDGTGESRQIKVALGGIGIVALFDGKDVA